MKNEELLKLVGVPVSVSDRFHAETIMRPSNNSMLSSAWPEEWKKKYYKAYPRFPQVVLPHPGHLPTKSYETIIEQRKSERAFGVTRLSAQKIGQLLYYSCGGRGKQDEHHSKRIYPSAGGRYPLEIYTVIRKSELPSAIYHYQIKEHYMEKIGPHKNFISKVCFNQSFINKAPLIIFITSVFKRMNIKYGDRSYRHIQIEAGHVGQLIYQTATCLDLACCAIGGYYDEEINMLLGLDVLREGVVYAMAIGEHSR